MSSSWSVKANKGFLDKKLHKGNKDWKSRNLGAETYLICLEHKSMPRDETREANWDKVVKTVLY